MNDEQTIEKLVNENLPLAHFFTNLYWPRIQRWVDRDECLSNAMLGLFDAAKTFDTAKNVKFSTHAMFHIKKRVYRPLVFLDRKKRGGLYPNLVHLDDHAGEGPELHDLIADTRGEDSEDLDLYNREKYLPLLKAALPKLKPRHRMIIMFRHGLGGLPMKSGEEIAQMYGVTRQYISLLEIEAMQAIKNLMAKP